VLLAMAIAGLSAGTAERPATLTKEAAAQAIKDIEKDRADTQKWLQSDPSSYLAAVSRRDFGDAESMSVGRAADNDVRLDDPAVSAHHLRVVATRDGFVVNAVDPDATFVVKGEAKREAALGPASLQVGRYQVRLSHQGFPALIVFDPESVRFKEYKGLKYFPIDLGYRYELPLVANPKPETLIVMSTRGNQRPATRVGWFDFMVRGKPYRLEAVRLLEPGVGENDLSIFFRDATTGKETYAVGRYLDVKKLASGKYLLDFNFAYNPACAFSDHYNCPIPSQANTLPVAIRAGEMDSKYH
jgi:uncharacterized protein (DUF1684 family)